jgi:thiaminase
MATFTNNIKQQKTKKNETQSTNVSYVDYLIRPIRTSQFSTFLRGMCAPQPGLIPEWLKHAAEERSIMRHVLFASYLAIRNLQLIQGSLSEYSN